MDSWSPVYTSVFIKDLTSRLESAKSDISQLQQHGDDLSGLLSAARGLVKALEKPEEKLLNIAKGPVGHAVLRFAFNINLLDRFDNGKATAEELACRCGVEHSLLVRIMRTLVGMELFEEDAEEVYSFNAFSQALMNTAFRAVVRGKSETTFIMPSLPEYLASINYRNPTDRHRSLFGFAKDTDITMFEWMETQPEVLAIFTAFQSATAEVSEWELKAVLRNLLSFRGHKSSEHPQETEVILVDIGGGKGKTLREVCADIPDLKGGIIVQDLPKTVEGQVTSHGVEAMTYNFFDPQPIIGARTYFFRHIFHNWSDETCRQILRNTLPALRHGSRIVIIDSILPNIGTPQFLAYMDISMMAFGGMERTESHWRSLLTGAGLRIVHMYSLDPSSKRADWAIEAIMDGDRESAS